MDYIIKDDNTVWKKSTLAHILDKRTVSFGEPSVTDLPETVNPLTLLKGFMQNHLIVISIKQSDIQQDLTGVIRVLRRLTPPGKSLLIIKELEPLESELSLEITDVCGVSTALHVTDTFTNGIIDE